MVVILSGCVLPLVKLVMLRVLYIFEILQLLHQLLFLLNMIASAGKVVYGTLYFFAMPVLSGLVHVGLLDKLAGLALACQKVLSKRT